MFSNVSQQLCKTEILQRRESLSLAFYLEVFSRLSPKGNSNLDELGMNRVGSCRYGWSLWDRVLERRELPRKEDPEIHKGPLKSLATYLALPVQGNTLQGRVGNSC